MKSIQEELKKVLETKDEKACAKAFEQFCSRHEGSLPLPGENTLFDKAMWAASKSMSLSKKDEAIVNRVTSKLLGESAEVVSAAVLKLKDLVGAGKDAAINTWQEMLAAMSWQQMVPAGALRGVGTQMISLGTFQKQLNDANIQVNLGWLVDKDQLRVLMQAKDGNEQALPEVELRVRERNQGVVFSRKTNQDGAVVAPAVQIGPGQYAIEIAWLNETAETPYFVI